LASAELERHPPYLTVVTCFSLASLQMIALMYSFLVVAAAADCSDGSCDSASLLQGRVGTVLTGQALAQNLQERSEDAPAQTPAPLCVNKWGDATCERAKETTYVNVVFDLCHPLYGHASSCMKTCGMCIGAGDEADTAAPTTEAPSTAAPTTAAPTTEAPSTAAPTTEAHAPIDTAGKPTSCGNCTGCLRANGICKKSWSKTKCDKNSKNWGVGKWCRH